MEVHEIVLQLSAAIEAFLPELSAKLPLLAVISFSIAVYGVFIYRFYHFVARRDVFGKFDLKKYQFDQTHPLAKEWATILGIVKYGIVFPVFVFIWFAVFSVLLFALAKNLPTEQLLLVAITFVTGIRLASYYTEDLSNDMAKLIPLVLLSVALIEPNFFSPELLQQRIDQLEYFIPDLKIYFAFVVLTEWTMRILLAAKHAIIGISGLRKKPQAETMSDENLKELISNFKDSEKIQEKH